MQYADTRRRGAAHLAAGLGLALALSGCTLLGADDEPTPDQQNPQDSAGETSETSPQNAEVVLVTHESFTLPDEVLAGFTEQTGYQVVVQASADAGALTNQLVLTKGSPIGDAVFGIDNTFASRAVNEGVLTAYSPSDLPPEVSEHALPGEAADYLTPIDYGDVCVNIDDAWFEAEGIEPPQTLADLTDPTYADLFVTSGASSSSPGLAFLIATIGEFGADGWQGYWRDLMANGAVITSGWSDSYGVDFTFSGGDRPIVLSYASSPPFTIPEGGEEPTTSALLDTCFRQVEYAGVLEGAANPEGAQALVDYLLTDEVQAAIPDAMFVYPVTDVELPELWAQWADVAPEPIQVDPELIEESREDWVREWADITTG
ncbi:thiamine ABC transporter substrate-binding protein [Ornithinimicrobium faecis]|uniref:Thiamine ABC transporter substrate-binding protein n=1 Tax=Ornithinimicrobium faecis TaxID=2934158 RepID=A0ABY4YTT9_9MICO|nr:thiamine ABC transporter substrate-binding protein [Ornithinimicrobium sp. HY1793]USQ79773.1 thiamine ABC transporter substrate-binding protein [Ornithinimicrobium sp. HY1793]